MSWGWVITIIAAVMLLMLVGFALYLWRLLTNIWAEVVVVGRRGEQVAQLLGTLDLSPMEPRPDADRDIPGDLRSPVAATVGSDEDEDEW